MTHNERGLRSQSTLGGHPVHPMLIPFPIAFLVGALATDLVFWITADPFWARASAWLIGAGFATGVIAAVFGLVDFLFIQRVRALNAAWYHFAGNAVVLALSLWNGALRIDDAAGAVLPTGLFLSAGVTALLLVTGWFGGELAYKHKIGAVEGLPTGLDAAPRPAASFVGEDEYPLYGTREAQAQAEAERERQQRG
jgi:uncharacterized membrane protein